MVSDTLFIITRSDGPGLAIGSDPHVVFEQALAARGVEEHLQREIGGGFGGGDGVEGEAGFAGERLDVARVAGRRRRQQLQDVFRQRQRFRRQRFEHRVERGVLLFGADDLRVHAARRRAPCSGSRARRSA